MTHINTFYEIKGSDMHYFIMAEFIALDLTGYSINHQSFNELKPVEIQNETIKTES